MIARATRILRPYENGMLGWPDDWTERSFNACNEPCDMLLGPCACGAWHYASDWVAVLEYYNAEIHEHA